MLYHTVYFELHNAHVFSFCLAFFGGGGVFQESSTGHGNGVQPALSNAASADSLRSCKTEPTPCYGKQLSNISFSNLTGDSNAGDYQDCGASSMLLMGEPPWCTPAHDIASPSGIRNDAVLRYKEKKKTRKLVHSLVFIDLIWR